MNKNVILGIVLSLVIVAVFVTLVFAYVGKGNSLSTAVSGGSCTGDSASCSSSSASCSSGSSSGCASSSAGCSSGGQTSCGGSSSPYYDPKVDYGAIEKQAVEFYAKATGDSSVKAKAFGIDKINVVIYKNDKILDRYTFTDGKFVK
jgi:hypothetical protein